MDRADHRRAEQPETRQLAERSPAAASGLQHVPHGGEAAQVSGAETRRPHTLCSCSTLPLSVQHSDNRNTTSNCSNNKQQET